MHNLQSYMYTGITMHGHPLPISLNKYCNLVLLPDLYDSLFSPRPMEPPCISSPRKGQLTGDVDDMTTPAAAPGCTTATAHMSSFVTTSIEQDDETDWDSDSDKLTQNFHMAGMTDYEDWAENDLDVGDHPACADDPPTIKHSHIEGASGIAEAPTSTTHPPDPMHLNMPEGSPHTEDDADVEGLTQEEGDANSNPEEKEIGQAGDNVLVEDEYNKEQE